MNRFYLKVSKRAGKICEYCLAPELALNFLFEVEHTIPRVLGGKTELENSALACRSCNIFKSDHLSGINESGLNTERLYNPRKDDWTEHFYIDLENFMILGLSEIGKGTINRLRLNNSLQIQAGKQCYRMELFP